MTAASAPAYVDVAVELPVRGTYRYRAPGDAARAWVGTRVLVPLGSRAVTGVVVATADEAPPGVAEVRAVEAIVDPEPQLSEELVALCLWVAEYYEAPPGEVFRVALPAGTRVTASSSIELTEAGRLALAGAGHGALTRGARAILGRLEGAGGAARRKDVLQAPAKAGDLTALVSAGLVAFSRDAPRARVRARTERVAVLAPGAEEQNRDALAARAPARAKVLEALAERGGEAPLAALRKAHPRAADHARALEGEGWLAIEERPADPDPFRGGADGMSAPAKAPELTEPQRRAVDALVAAIARAEFEAFLLHGITGSGKTEVYLHAIARAMEADLSAVVLVPEISLTPQLAARFRARFGDRVAVLHSALTERQRYDEWHRLRSGAARIALGARSAVFAPVRDLGVIIVDEEHDASFKQEEGVRYSARDVALVRAKRAGAACVLGSATPSLESAHSAERGRLRVLPLPARASGASLPNVELVDLRTFKPAAGSMLTAPLSEAVTAALSRGEQVILFLNRRGFATFVVCGRCGHAFRCDNCSVSLTYHQWRDRLLCHYCGHGERLSDTCPGCGGAGTILRRGFGTEQIAEATAASFPAARVARLDRDVATGAKIARVLSRVARREVDILVGTQMVTKGHDFSGVTLVGVLCADTALSLPDFRASERTYQLLTQVAGRAGRGERPGRVIVQTYQSDVPAIAAAASHDYDGFCRQELAARRELGYPPFGHLVALRVDGRDATDVEATARELARAARRLRGAAAEPEVLGPAEAPLSRLKGRTRWQLWMRASERKALRALLRRLVAEDRSGTARVTIDVDPVSTL